MYEIISAGTLIALCEKPRYIRVKEETGVLVEAPKEEATGVAVDGVAYNLPGSTAIPDAPEAIVRAGDTGGYVFRNRVTIEETAQAAGSAIISVEEAVCELDTASDSRMSALEDAVCELDGLINGGGET